MTRRVRRLAFAVELLGGRWAPCHRRSPCRGRGREFMTQDRPFHRGQKIEQKARFLLSFPPIKCAFGRCVLVVELPALRAV
jgi:hypothetical protein